MTVHEFIKKRPYLVWSVKDLDSLSEESIVENTINYGTLDDIKEIFKILTLEKTAKIFNDQLKNKRNNYSPKIRNYFRLYFNKYGGRTLN